MLARSLVLAEARLRAFHVPPAIAALAEFLGLLLLFTIVTAAVFRRWLPHLGEALIGPPEDNLQDLWNTWYVAAGRHPGQPFFFTDLLRFPEGAPLYLHSFAYPKVFAIALLTRIVGADMGTLVLLQNLSMLASFPLAGVGAFLIARHLTGSWAGALLGGFVFAFNPSHVGHAMHHAGVSSIEAIPFFVLCYLLAMGRRSTAFLLLAIGLYALSALSSWYYLVYLACFIAFHAAYATVRERRLPGGWRLAAAVACPVAVVAILAPMLVPMTHAAAEAAAPSAVGTGVYAADLAGLAAFPRFHALAPLADGVYRELKGNAWESTVYLGLANLALLSWAGLSRRARPAPVLTYALCGMGTFCIVAAGSRLQVLGHETIPLPGAALSALPLLSLMQAPARAIALVYLFLAIAVAEAARAIWEQGAGLRRAAMAGVAAVIVLDYLPVRALALTPLSCPAGLEAIRDDPETGFGVLDLPPHGYAERNFYMAQQACHGRPIVLGNTSRRAGPTLGDRLDTWTVESQRAQLVAARIKYVVLRSPTAADHGPVWMRAQGEERLRFAWRPEDAPPAHYAAVYRVVYESPDLTIFRAY
jgi:hypothetical protein